MLRSSARQDKEFAFIAFGFDTAAGQDDIIYKPYP